MIKIGITPGLGTEIAADLLKKHREELEKRFSASFLHKFEEWMKSPDGNTSARVLSDGKKVRDSHLLFQSSVKEGGLYAALWAACDELQKNDFNGHSAGSPVGCFIDPEKVPLRQEIIEICELYGENPYECSSEGTRLLVWEEEQMPETGLTANPGEEGCSRRNSIAVIGWLTKGKERILSYPEGIRYLTPPARQQKDMEDRRQHRHGTEPG